MESKGLSNSVAVFLRGKESKDCSKSVLLLGEVAVGILSQELHDLLCPVPYVLTGPLLKLVEE